MNDNQNIEDFSLVQKVADNLQIEPNRASLSDYIIANVDMQLADEAFRRDGSYYIGRGDVGLGRRDKIRQLIQSGELRDAPIVHIRMGYDSKPILSFTDGRHRFAELRDAGATSINLAVDPDSEKYVSLLQNNNLDEDDYRGEHTAPDSDDSPLHDVTNAFGGEDMYTDKALRYFGTHSNYDNYSIYLIQSARNRPNMPVKIYRAIPKVITTQEKINDYENQKKYILKTGKLPKGVTNWQNSSEYYDYISDELESLRANTMADESRVTINDGDWVSINPAYAKEHGDRHLGRGKYRVITKTVPARQVFTNGDSMHEWGYSV